MSRIEFEALMELSRKSTTEKPRSELVVLALGINGITAKVKSEHNSGWFSLNVEEFEEIIPKLMSRNLLQVEEANYDIPTNLLSVLKDLIEENLFPESLSSDIWFSQFLLSWQRPSRIAPLPT